MYLKIDFLEKNDMYQKYNFFSEEYQNGFIGRPFFEESLHARSLISEYIGGLYQPQVDNLGIPIFQDSSFWSLSHKKGCVFVGVSKSEIGLDIEYFLEKSPELLDIFPFLFYNALGEKNWKHFYVLWTSFEAIQKMERWKNMSIDEFSLLTFETIKINISGVIFHTRTLFDCKEKIYQVFTGFDENTIYSVCTSQNFDYEIIS